MEREGEKENRIRNGRDKREAKRVKKLIKMCSLSGLGVQGTL